MFGLKTLDVGIGMALMFLFVSLICSAVREFGELATKTRASTLKAGIVEMLGSSRVEAFFEQPHISALYKGNYQGALVSSILSWIPFLGRTKLPSYIPSGNFAKAALQLIRSETTLASTAALAVSDVRAWTGPVPGDQKPEDDLRKAVRSILDSTGDDLNALQTGLEQWFNSTMDRVSGWYKSRTQIWLLVIGFVAAALMNIDAITVMQRLSTDDKLRDQVVAQAGSTIAECTKDPAQCGAPPKQGGTPDTLNTKLDNIKAATAQMTQVSWPIGWSGGYPDPQFKLLSSGPSDKNDAAAAYAAMTGWDQLLWWLGIIGGWLITAIGVTFGSSFWFDVLNRFMVVRSTIKPDEKSPKEKSKS
ncbi:hypothetical protein GCM10009087_40590 [Sphingomonas oligophenolica]|uniref:Transmembrane protein n=1 Tax=Sphingomonas oligophenolica TaxID=301154 RepID=A0ABU9Y208_9SPHN